MKTYNKPQVEVNELRSIGILMASPAASGESVSYGGTADNMVAF